MSPQAAHDLTHALDELEEALRHTYRALRRWRNATPELDPWIASRIEKFEEAILQYDRVDDAPNPTEFFITLAKANNALTKLPEGPSPARSVLEAFIDRAMGFIFRTRDVTPNKHDTSSPEEVTDE